MMPYFPWCDCSSRRCSTTIAVPTKMAVAQIRLERKFGSVASCPGAAEAIRAYIDLNEWQIAEIKAALKQADAGDFASEKEVRGVMRKWRRGAGQMA
jgi:hypothetical protein